MCPLADAATVDSASIDAIVVDALGLRIGLDLSLLDAAGADAVRTAWADALAADHGAPRDVTIVVEARSGIARLLNELSHEVTRAAMDHRRGEGWMLHAGAVAHDDGTVVVLVGASGSGKTTAVRALGRTRGYVTDETVFIDGDGGVLAYRKPLSVIDESGMPKHERSPSLLGLQELPSTPLRVGAIVLLDRRDDGPEHPVLEPVELGDALVALVAQSSHLLALPAALGTIAGHITAAGGVQRVTYRDADDLVDVVLDLDSDTSRISDDSGAIPPQSVSSASFDAEHSGDAAASGSVYTRTPTADTLVLHDPERLAILANGTLHIVAGIAPAIWRAAGGARIEHITAAVVAEHGAPADGDAAAAVADAVAALVAAGLLVGGTPGWSIRDDVAWTDDGAQVFALALADWRAGSPLALSGSSAAIWRALADAPGSALAQVIDTLADDYGVPHAAIREQVEAFLGELVEADLVSGPPSRVP